MKMNTRDKTSSDYPISELFQEGILKTKKHEATVLQVVPSLVTGGVERGTVDIAKTLVDNNFNSIVSSSGGPLVQQILAAGGKHIKLRVATKHPFMIWRNSRALENIIREFNVDIIHARSRAPGWSSYIASKNTNARFITTFHGIYNFSTKLKKYYNSVMTRGERVIAVSHFVKNHLIENYGTNEEDIRVIHRGVDHNYFSINNLTSDRREKFKEKYHIPSNVPILLLPARMTSWKGHMVLVDALNLLHNEEFYCIMAGDLSKHPNFTHRLQNKILECKLQSKIQIFGPEADMMGLYGVSDIVLSTSIEPEAFGRVVVEAQAMEKLVIATNIGGAAETIVDGISGYHTIPNDPTDLADKIRYALSILGSSAAQKITTEARHSAMNKFSLDSMLAQTLSVYRELL
jgi:glycosyltransferase involved in cell wall biosynthesis